MNDLFKRYKWAGILLGVLLVAAGVLTIVFAFVGKDNLNFLLSLVIAITLFVVGASYLVAGCMASLNNFYTSLFLYGGVAIAIGVILLVNNSIAPSVMTYTLSILLLTFGAVYLVRAILYIVAKSETKIIIFALCLAIACIALGIISLVFKGTMLTFIYVVFGVLLLGAGVIQVIAVTKK